MQSWLLTKSVCAWGKICFFKKSLRTSSYIISSILLVVHEFSSKCCLWNYKAVMPTDSAVLHFFSLTLYLWPGKRPSHRQCIYFFQYKVYQVYYMWILFQFLYVNRGGNTNCIKILAKLCQGIEIWKYISNFQHKTRQKSASSKREFHVFTLWHHLV